MITRAQALRLRHGTEIHHGRCSRKKGPRGGVRVVQERWRVSGRVKTWKTRPTHFEVPIKYGLRGNGYLTHRNAQSFHLASSCRVRW